MLIWVCAMRCEAKPIIDFYRLQKCPAHALPFELYQTADQYCIVSGIGQHNITHTLEQAQQTLPVNIKSQWINLGIAGHRSLPVGSLRLIHAVTDAQQVDTVALALPAQHALKTAAAMSVQRESSDYPQTAIIDMEAYHFAHHCQRSTQISAYHCLKVISDNAHTAPTRNKARISAMIADNMRQITAFAQHLQETCR